MININEKSVQLSFDYFPELQRQKALPTRPLIDQINKVGGWVGNLLLCHDSTRF